jgi:DNA-directed RNA polymerase subunit M/transcription elongation factor TFIIS
MTNAQMKCPNCHSENVVIWNPYPPGALIQFETDVPEFWAVTCRNCKRETVHYWTQRNKAIEEFLSGTTARAVSHDGGKSVYDS